MTPDRAFNDARPCALGMTPRLAYPYLYQREREAGRGRYLDRLACSE